MRIAALSERSGVSVPTIKYYVREGLLPPGELTSPNQARYGEEHLRRLRLIRALVDVGGLSIAATRDVLASIDSPGKSLHQTLGKAQHAVTPSLDEEVDDAAWAAASATVEELARRRDWQVGPDHPAWRLLTHVLAALNALGQADLIGPLDAYADAAERIAEVDVETVLARRDLDSVLEGVVVGTVLGDSLLAALRRLAQANASARLTPKRRAVRQTNARPA